MVISNHLKNLLPSFLSPLFLNNPFVHNIVPGAVGKLEEVGDSVSAVVL